MTFWPGPGLDPALATNLALPLALDLSLAFALGPIAFVAFGPERLVVRAIGPNVAGHSARPASGIGLPLALGLGRRALDLDVAHLPAIVARTARLSLGAAFRFALALGLTFA